MTRTLNCPVCEREVPAGVRDWCIERLLKQWHWPDSRVTNAEQIPADYGLYRMYDGFTVVSGGASRNLRVTFAVHQNRLGAAEVPIFMWVPDLRGDVRRMLDPEKPSSDGPTGRCSG